jgi:heme exporter protein B
MTDVKQIINLVKKDILLEVRQQYTFYGIILYVASTIFVIYLTMGQPEEQIWNGLFWIVQLFICTNAVAKSFLSESKGRMLYFYTIAGARVFILSKLFFNLMLMLVMSLLSLIIFTLLLNNPLHNALLFVGITTLGGISLSLVFTFLSAIAAKAMQQAALMAILGFPLILPQLLLLMKITTPAFSNVIQESWGQMVILLVGLDVMIILLAVILFPFLWRD